MNQALTVMVNRIGKELCVCHATTLLQGLTGVRHCFDNGDCDARLSNCILNCHASGVQHLVTDDIVLDERLYSNTNRCIGHGRVIGVIHALLQEKVQHGND